MIDLLLLLMTIYYIQKFIGGFNNKIKEFPNDIIANRIHEIKLKTLYQIYIVIGAKNCVRR